MAQPRLATLTTSTHFTEDRDDIDDACTRRAASSFRDFLESLGLDMNDPNLSGTEWRVARAFRELLAGHYAGVEPSLRTFPNSEGYSEAVAVTDIPLRLSACVPGHQSFISPLVRTLMEAVQQTGFAAEREFEIETALREALANAAVHGCGNDPSKVVECELSCDGSAELAIVVRDHGPGFDPASVPNPLAEENLLSTHGRGIYLITELMDDVWFERGGAEIHMVLRPAGTPSRVSAGPARRPSHLFSW